MSFVQVGHPIHAPTPLGRCALGFASPLSARRGYNPPGFRSTLLPLPSHCHKDVAQVVSYAVEPTVLKVPRRLDQRCLTASNGLPLLRLVHPQSAYSSPRVVRADLVRTISCPVPVVPNPNIGAVGGRPAMNRLLFPHRFSPLPRAQSMTCRAPRPRVVPLQRCASYHGPEPHRAELLPRVALEQGMPPMARAGTCAHALQASVPCADAPSQEEQARVSHPLECGDGEADVSTCCTLPPRTQEKSTSQGSQEVRTLSDQPGDVPNLGLALLPLHVPIAQMNSEDQGSKNCPQRDINETSPSRCFAGQTPRSLNYTASEDVDSSVIGTLTTANTPLCTPTPSACSPEPRLSHGPRISVSSNDAQEVAAKTPLCTPTPMADSPAPRLSDGPRKSVTFNDVQEVAATPCSDPAQIEPQTWVLRYMEEFGYMPRSAQQLVAFAAHRGGQLPYSMARKLL